MRELAWHETLELHELIAFQSVLLFKLKKAIQNVNDAELKSLYQVSIQTIEGNLRELLSFLSTIQASREGKEMPLLEDGFYAGDLLAAAKTSVRNYAIAITETATPELREVLLKQLNGAVRWHEQVYNYMARRGLYPSYDLGKLLQGDVFRAQNAISMKY